MKKEFVDLVKYRLGKAGNTLSDGKKYIKDATLESTVNRIYYAMFYAVRCNHFKYSKCQSEFL